MNKKEKLREYKSTPRPMGVFQVRNRENDKRLIGISKNLPGIMNRIRMELVMKNCPIRSLQEDWNHFGESAFEFQILENLDSLDNPDYDPSEDLQYLEKEWLEKLNPYEERGYNIRPKRLG